MQMINVEDIPGGDLKRRKTIRTLLLNELGSSDSHLKITYTLYDENKKILIAGEVEDIPSISSQEDRLLRVLEKIVHPTV